MAPVYRFDNDDKILTMLTANEDRNALKTTEAYARLMADTTNRFAGGGQEEMCWPTDWYPEHLPTESARGNSMHFYLQGVADPLAAADGGQWPPVDYADVQPWNVLVFSDSYGYCKEILQQAPPGRIGIRNVQTKAASAYDDNLVLKLLQEREWDLVLFGVGIDPPPSNSLEDIHKTQDAVLKMMLCMAKELVDKPEFAKRVCVLTCDCFACEPEIHEECGLGLITNACLYGFVNTARVECVSTNWMYIDTEWALRTENTKYLVAEIFREDSFGQNNVRILNQGRFVQRKIPAKQVETKEEFQVPDEGVIAITGGNGALGLIMGLWLLRKAKEQGGKKFGIKFLSRSMKIDDMNMKNWQDIQVLAKDLGIKVEQAKCDGGNPESVEELIRGMNGNLAGFIHSAGVLRDSMVMNQTWQKFDETFQAKSRAAVFFHDALQRMPQKNLQFFWMFSSQAVYGSMGQLPYSSSNSQLDAIARHRRAMGQPGMAPQWGAWGEAGMAAGLKEADKRRMANSPTPPFTNAQGLYGLECGLRTKWAYFEVARFTPAMWFGIVQADGDYIALWNRHLYSFLFTPAPGDRDKNAYVTYSYTMRRQTASKPGLFLEAWQPEAAALMEYENAED